MALHLHANNVLAMHWGTIIMTEEPPFEPPQRFRVAASRAGFSPERAWLMRIGETRAMPNCAARAGSAEAA
jgi:L-ascorbate metabolism protein UlaG (beta-lactamase superfamily)